MAEQQRTVALIGPGRAGTTVALGLMEQGWTVVGVGGSGPGRTLDRVRGRVSRLARRARVGSRARRRPRIGRDPRPGDRAGAPHGGARDRTRCARRASRGSRGLDVFGALLERRTGLRVGALHPLQSFPSTSVGLERLSGAWAAVAGDPAVADIARSLGLRPFELADADRGRYHAAAVIASNHLVALLGQVERLATTCAVPFEAFAPLVMGSVQNAFALGPADALTGPVARGDLATVEQHLRDLDPAERDAYRALAREAARLTGRRDTGLDRLLGDLRQHPDPPGD